MLDKRGQGLSTNAIILIILGVVILVVLIVGFTVGWGSFAPWLATDNVNSVVQQCGIACNSDNVYDFCSRERVLKADDLPGGVKEVKGNCTFFADEANYDKYGIEECSAVSC